jgi:DNA-binding NarL/FixJ family response regulator
MTDRPGPGPVRIAIVNDYELVVRGVAALLEPYADRVAVLELDAKVAVVQDVDVILYDTFGQVQGDGLDLDHLVENHDAKVAIFSWNLQPDLVSRSIQSGASGYLSKSLQGEELVRAIEAVHAGQVVVPTRSSGRDREAGDWPGKTRGLTAREAEIIALITQGLSNQEIATRSYLSINSVKTYIRTAYRKMGVSSRSQAVLWGVNNGFRPDVMRETSPHRPR